MYTIGKVWRLQQHFKLLYKWLAQKSSTFLQLLLDIKAFMRSNPLLRLVPYVENISLHFCPQKTLCVVKSVTSSYTNYKPNSNVVMIAILLINMTLHRCISQAYFKWRQLQTEVVKWRRRVTPQTQLWRASLTSQGERHSMMLGRHRRAE
jgi:hypothetical protein